MHTLKVLSFLYMTTKIINALTTTGNRPKVLFHWFRHGDLRVHDNAALIHSSKIGADLCVPIFIFDEDAFGDKARTPYGHLKHGSKRAKFIAESVQDLRKQLESIGSGLAIVHGEPASVFENILKDIPNIHDIDVSVVCQEEVSSEERDAVEAVRTAMEKSNSNGKRDIRTVWGSTMYEREDLPFDADLLDMPDTFTPFRHKVEKKCDINRPLPVPKAGSIPLNSDTVTVGSSLRDMLTAPIPSLEEMRYTDSQITHANEHDSRSVMLFEGGETAALSRVKDYIWTKDLLKNYFDTRNGMIGADYSTKFSPWLAHGCVSPRYIASECRKYEEQRVENKSTYWVVFEMLWRDYCKYYCTKHGNSIFFRGGPINKEKKWSTYAGNFEAWRTGKTGYPLVDANMRELAATGFMSNRGRQNVCSFLTIDLNHDWRMGAYWFEETLLDYDVYSNWYNWCAGAGMTGGRLNRFNIVKQSKDYDLQGEYVRYWCPELKDVPNNLVHEPWKMTQFQQAENNCVLGVDYPNPIIAPSQPQKKGGKDQKPQRRKKGASNNAHQAYEMKSLKKGNFKFKG